MRDGILLLKGLNWLKELIVWSWTYLWAAWFVLVSGWIDGWFITYTSLVRWFVLVSIGSWLPIAHHWWESLKPDLVRWVAKNLSVIWNLKVGFVLFYLRGPLKIGENLGMATMFLSTLTPKVNISEAANGTFYIKSQPSSSTWRSPAPPLSSLGSSSSLSGGTIVAMACPSSSR